MNVSVARRYARALVESAAGEGTLEATGTVLAELVATVSDPAIAATLSSPLLKPSMRLQLLERISELLQAPPLVRRFVALVSERGRVDELKMIGLHYAKLADEKLGRVRGFVAAPQELSAVSLDRIRDQLEAALGKTVLLEQNADPSLLAGVKVEIDGRVFDGSLRTQLTHLADAMSRGESVA